MRNVGDKFRARLAVRIEKLLARSVGAKMGFIFRSKKRRFVMIEPPGQFVRRRIFKIDDRILVAIKHFFVKEIAWTMQQSVVVDLCLGMDPFFIETCEGGGRSNAVKAVAVIK